MKLFIDVIPVEIKREDTDTASKENKNGPVETKKEGTEGGHGCK